MNTKAPLAAQGSELTPMQQGMLFNALFAPNAGIDLEQVICRLPEAIEVMSLQRAWRNTVRRLGILRSSFMWEGLDSPKCIVHEEVNVEITQIDLSDQSPSEQEKFFNSYCLTDRHNGFIYDVPPLMRLSLFRFAQSQYRLLWTFPHALLDGRSFPLVLGEVFDDYERICAGTSENTTPLPQFVDYAIWSSRQDHLASESFWRGKLAGFKAPTPFMPDLKQGAVPSSPLHPSVSCEIPGDVSLKLTALTDPKTATLHTFLQAAWAILISRYSSEKDVVFGSTRACRHAEVPGIKSMVGILINTLPFRISCDEALTLADFLRDIRKQQIELRDVENTPLMKIQEWSELARGTRLFDSILVYDDRSLETILQSRGGKWTNRRFDILEKTNFPVTVLAWGHPRISLRLQYDPAKMSERQAAQMLTQMANLLKAMSAGLDQRLFDLDHLGDQYRKLALSEWNVPAESAETGRCLHHLVENSVQHHPQKIALVSGNERISYSELERRASIVASSLQAHGLTGNEPVAIILDRSVNLPIALYGVLKAGGCYVPLDPTYPKERIASVLEQTQARFVITAGASSKDLIFARQQIVIDLGPEWFLSLAHKDFTPQPTKATDLAYIIFTSGSTGRPKGVMIEHQGAVNTILDLNSRFRLVPADSILAISAYTFDLSVFDIFGMLASGGTVVMPEPGSSRDPYHWVNLISQEKITVWNSVPALVEMLLAATTATTETLRSLRLVMMSGDWIPITLPERIKSCVPSSFQVSLGGATEASIWSILHPIWPTDPKWTSIPYGRPMKNQSMYVLDARLEPCALGVRGELFIGGIGLARGYWGDEEKTRRSFITHPSSGQRLYRTGDLGRWHEDGLIEFLGRIDGQIKIRGFRIELGEIETVASHHHEIKDCVVARREDIPGHATLALYFVKKEDSTVTGEMIKVYLQQKLPEYMVPNHYIQMAAFPLSSNGKVDKNQLPVPESRPRVFSRTPDELEGKLIAIWSELLACSDIAVGDSFFDLGGNSLLAMKLIDRIDCQCALKTTLSCIFQNPTIERLAAQLRQDNQQQTSILIPLQVNGSRRPFFFISGYLDIGRHVGEDQPFYGLDCPAEAKAHHPNISFQELAETCISEMKRIQKKGPYLLGGHCFGAVVAFTIANLLQHRGEKVRLLALMDPPLPASISSESGRINRLRYHLKNIIRRNPIAQIRYLRERITNFRNRISERMRGERFDEIYRDFKPEVFQGQLAMFFAEDTFLRYNPSEDPRLQWSQWASAGIEIIESAGDHVTFCREPHVQGLGKKLRDYIDKVQALTPPPEGLAKPGEARIGKSDFPTCTVGEGVGELI